MSYEAKYPQNKMRIKKEFVSSVLRETAEQIRDAQQETASEWGLFESGELERSLKGHFSVDQNSNDGRLTMRYLNYARFLDMADKRRQRKREGYHLYNRIIFGHLYGKTLPSLQYGFTNDIREGIAKRLGAVAGMDMPFYKKIDLQLKEVSNYDPGLASVMAKSYRTGY